MRMWMTPPAMMCRKHLLGEHVECHMFLGTMIKNKSLKGYVDNNLFEMKSLFDRHQKLSDEMISRGYNHQSLIDYNVFLKAIDGYPAVIRDSKVDVDQSFNELKSRCISCGKK